MSTSAFALVADSAVSKLIAEAQDLLRQCELMNTTSGYQRLSSKITAELAFLRKVILYYCFIIKRVYWLRGCFNLFLRQLLACHSVIVLQ